MTIAFAEEMMEEDGIGNSKFCKYAEKDSVKNIKENCLHCGN